MPNFQNRCWVLLADEIVTCNVPLQQFLVSRAFQTIQCQILQLLLYISIIIIIIFHTEMTISRTHSALKCTIYYLQILVCYFFFSSSFSLPHPQMSLTAYFSLTKFSANKILGTISFHTHKVFFNPYSAPYTWRW